MPSQTDSFYLLYVVAAKRPLKKELKTRIALDPFSKKKKKPSFGNQRKELQSQKKLELK